MDQHNNEPSAAVAVIRIKGNDPSYLVLKRADHQRDPWSGHCAFPGGAREKDDTNLLATCVRETREECGIVITETELVDSLPHAVAGNHIGNPVLVAPYLFELETKPEVTIDVQEISRYYWLSTLYLTNPENRGRRIFVQDLPGQNFPYIRLKDAYLWGFTYKVLMSILE